MESDSKMTSKINPPGDLFGQNVSKILVPQITGSVLEPTFFEHQNFDDILEPFWLILLPFGSILAPFGRLLTSFWRLLASFCMHFLDLATSLDKIGIDFRRCVFTNIIWSQTYKRTHPRTTKQQTHKQAWRNARSRTACYRAIRANRHGPNLATISHRNRSNGDFRFNLHNI